MSRHPIGTPARTERSERAGGAEVSRFYSRSSFPFPTRLYVVVGVGRTQDRKEIQVSSFFCFNAERLGVGRSRRRPAPIELHQTCSVSLSYLIRQPDVLLEGPDGGVGQLDEDDALLCRRCRGRRRRCRCCCCCRLRQLQSSSSVSGGGGILQQRLGQRPRPCGRRGPPVAMRDTFDAAAAAAAVTFHGQCNIFTRIRTSLEGWLQGYSLYEYLHG